MDAMDSIDLETSLGKTSLTETSSIVRATHEDSEKIFPKPKPLKLDMKPVTAAAFRRSRDILAAQYFEE